MRLIDRLRSMVSDDVRRVALLLVVCVSSAILVVDHTSVPSESLHVGDVAHRTVEAPFTFRYQDFADRERRQEEAREAVAPVYVYRADLDAHLQGRISNAFEAGRLALEEVLQARGLTDPAELVEAPEEVVAAFREELGAHVPEKVVTPLMHAGFPAEAERLAGELLGRALSAPVISDRQQLPPSEQALKILAVDGTERSETTVRDHDVIGTPASARERLNLGILDAARPDAPWSDAAVTVARALVRPNLDYDHLQTEERRERAAAAVPMEPILVKRGTTLFRQGDVLTETDIVRYRALQSSRSDHGVGFQVLSVALFLLLLLGSLYHFGATFLHDFSTRVRDIAAAGLLLIVTAFLARVVVGTSGSLAALLGAEAEPSSVWFVVPVAGAAMLVRLLLGISWAAVFAVAASVLCGLVMDLEALYVTFFLISAIAAAGAVEHTRERMAVLRGGLVVGLIGAATVLLVHFLELVLADGETLSSPLTPVWSMAFALLGGVLSSFMALALVPLFETFGFVTDYRLMELANLNHPLLRQLMLRAPGSYHHSVIVGSLAEAAAESVGANALQARVCAYFHDIGKTVKPAYFIENQRGGVNRHDQLGPTASAQVIIAHVVDGGRMAREHNLPKPIVDNIYMHHGTGLLQYFYAQARREAEDPDSVDEDAFRYPGPKPNTREAGIIMLADKIEAATRTIQAPTEENVRAMIERIINSVMADGQFEHCPLTFQELYTIGDTFVKVLLGIYHHRIEYPETAGISRGAAPAPPAPARSPGVITLEIPSPLRKARTGTDDLTEDEDVKDDPTEDYESVENLPGGK